MPAKKSDKSKKEEKVVDVAKPGTYKPEIGSKPMVVGHKSLNSDPTIKDENTEKKAEELKDEGLMSSSKKVRIEPLSKPEEEQEPDKKDDSSKSDDTSANEEVKSDNEKKEEELDERMERDEQLKQLISSKEYNVKIKDSSSSGIKTFFLSFFIVLLLGIVAIALLIDAEILDLGVELPFDLL